MADRGKDKDTKPVFDADLTKGDEVDEESTEPAEIEDDVEAGAEGDEIENAEGEEGDEYPEDETEGAPAKVKKAAGSAAGVGAFHFSLHRGGKGEEEVGRHQGGSVQATHERVHIDDRPSAIYALACAGGLIGILVLTLVGGALPASTGPSLAPLVVPTGKPTPTACITPSPIVTATPLATATSSASVKPTATPKPTPTLNPTESAAASAAASGQAAVASAQASATASAQASAVASFCAIPVATATPSVAASPSASASK